jgi:O-antigen/teichoic acid export membrane protein
MNVEETFMTTLRDMSKKYALLISFALIFTLLEPTLLMAGKKKKIVIGTAAGAAVGALAGGGKGAALGAGAGAAGGYAYHRIKEDKYRQHARSKKRTAKVVGASAVAGGLTGALIGGKKGAIIGAAAGGGGGYLIDQKVKSKKRVYAKK